MKFSQTSGFFQFEVMSTFTSGRLRTCILLYSHQNGVTIKMVAGITAHLGLLKYDNGPPLILGYAHEGPIIPLPQIQLIG